jgi:hypothetical protein
MPTKWLQERQDGSKNDVGITPRRAFSGHERGIERWQESVSERGRERGRKRARDNRERERRGGGKAVVKQRCTPFLCVCVCVCVSEREREKGRERERERERVDGYYPHTSKWATFIGRNV